ncbi:MAG: hypothetical protein ACP5QO_00750 [Clostridia bacterium]
MSLFLWFIVGIGVLGVFLTFWLIQKGYQMERAERQQDLGSVEPRAKTSVREAGRDRDGGPSR